jgi:hypothetical protein
MKKLAFVLFVAILGLSMTGLAPASQWTGVYHEYDNVFSGPLGLEEGQKIKIVFHPQGAVDQLAVDLAGGGAALAAAEAPAELKIKVKGMGTVFQGAPGDVPGALALLNVAGNVKVKVFAVAGGVNVNLAQVSDSGQGGQTHAPEPASMLLLGSGLVGMVAVGRRKFFKK